MKDLDAFILDDMTWGSEQANSLLRYLVVGMQ